MTAQVHDLAAARESHAERLEAAGWRSKERCGKRIWSHPQTGYWYAEEMALEIAERRREGEGEEC